MIQRPRELRTIANSKNQRLRVRHFAEELASYLIEQDFIVHFYQAKTSSSVYLKLDYGAGYSIRISDHQGKPDLDYRFNLMLGMNTEETRLFSESLPAPKYPRLFFSIQDLELLKHAILLSRQHLIETQGHFEYKERKALYKKQFKFKKNSERKTFYNLSHRIYK